MYDASERSAYTKATCDMAVGQHATLPLTGKIVEAGESDSGPYVKFEVDANWGFPEGTRFGIDLDALVLS